MDQVLCKMTAVQHRLGLSCASSSTLILMTLFLSQNKGDSYFPGYIIFAYNNLPIHSSIFPNLFLIPRFETVGFWEQGPSDIKTSRSKGENQQQTQRSYSATSGRCCLTHQFSPKLSNWKEAEFLFYLRFILSVINPFTAKCGQRQISTKLPNFVF